MGLTTRVPWGGILKKVPEIEAVSDKSRVVGSRFSTAFRHGDKGSDLGRMQNMKYRKFQYLHTYQKQ